MREVDFKKTIKTMAGAVAVFLLTTTHSPAATKRESKMIEVKTCLGRFMMKRPAGWNETGRYQLFYGTELTENLTQFIESFSSEKKAIQVLRGEGLKKFKLIEERQLEDFTAAAAFSAQGGSSSARTFAALLGRIESGVRFQAQYSEGRIEYLEKLFKIIAKMYQPGSRVGFCLENGSMVGEASLRETTRLSFRNANLGDDVSLTFSTQTTSSPEKTDHAANIAMKLLSFTDNKFGIKESKRSLKNVAGLNGTIEYVKFEEKGKPPTATFKFVFPGAKNSSTEPALNAVIEGPFEMRDSLEHSLHEFLDSIEKNVLAK